MCANGSIIVRIFLQVTDNLNISEKLKNDRNVVNIISFFYLKYLTNSFY